MVEYNSHLNTIFGSLSDPTRRDILRRVAKKELSVSEVAAHYSMSLAAVSKHLKVLEEARLIVKHKRGKQHFVALSPPALHEADKFFEHYKKLWEERFDRLEQYLKDNK